MASFVRCVFRPASFRCSQFRSVTSIPYQEESIFSEDHKRLRESLRKLIDVEINPYVEEWEESPPFPAHKVMKKLGEHGFLGATMPEQYGGLGLDYSYAVAIAEELGHIKNGGVPMAIGVQSDMTTPALAMFGSDELKKSFLSPTIAGDMVACLGVSEVGSGSDVASIKTTAKRSGDDLVINGGKMWTTSGSQADWMCLLANTSEGPDVHKNKSLICLPMKTKGVTVDRILKKLGHHSSDTAQIFFDNVRIPSRNIIGEEGKGFMYQMMQFQRERLWAASSILLPLERLISETADYTRERKAFGRSILSNQTVHFRLAELESEVEALRSLVYRAAGLHMKGYDVTKLASMAKLKAGRLSRETTDACLQFWGGMGYMSEMEVSRMYRDVRLLSIGAGADEVMLSIICKLSGTLPN